MGSEKLKCVFGGCGSNSCCAAGSALWCACTPPPQGHQLTSLQTPREVWTLSCVVTAFVQMLQRWIPGLLSHTQRCKTCCNGGGNRSKPEDMWNNSWSHWTSFLFPQFLLFFLSAKAFFSLLFAFTTDPYKDEANSTCSHHHTLLFSSRSPLLL